LLETTEGESSAIEKGWSGNWSLFLPYIAKAGVGPVEWGLEVMKGGLLGLLEDETNKAQNHTHQ